MRKLLPLSSLSLLLLSGGVIPVQAQAPDSQMSQPMITIDLNRAKNYARQAAEEANGGLQRYRAEDAMHGPAAQSPYVENADGSWTFTFLGGPPGWTTATVESVVTVTRNARVTVEYNGTVRDASSRTRPTTGGNSFSQVPLTSGEPSRWENNQQAAVVREWSTVLRTTRLVDRSALALQLDVLQKPVTSYANVVYLVYGRKDDRWVQLYSSLGARLLPNGSDRVNLQPEVIELNQLRLGELDLSQLDLKTVAQIRYDAAGQRDQQVVFEQVQNYATLTQISSQQLTTVSSTTLSPSNPSTGGGPSITFGNGFRITFLGVNYSGSNSIWRYYVEQLSTAQDLSNWVLGLPRCAGIVSTTPRGELVDPDPNARISGVKWQPGGGFRQGEFAVTLSGPLTIGTVDVAAKGPDVARALLAGPSCKSF